MPGYRMHLVGGAAAYLSLLLLCSWLNQTCIEFGVILINNANISF